ncbi:hypothetical protein BJX99DRAFT_253017 [Aspergillus californicus]
MNLISCFFPPIYHFINHITRSSQEETKAVRLKCRQYLHPRFGFLATELRAEIDAELATEMGICLEDLGLDRDDTETEGKKIIDDGVTARFHKTSEGCFKEDPVESTPEDSGTAELLNSVLGQQFSQYRRAGLDDGENIDTQTADISGWHPCDIDEKFLAENYISFAFNNALDPLVPWSVDLGNAWNRWEGNRKEKPHVCFTMMHNVPPPATDGLLRTEALTIMGVMLTRLRGAGGKGHAVFPVQAISIFDRYQARIIQSYMSEAGLDFVKSPLYDFSTPEERENVKIFLRYMASEPVGDTRVFKFG